MSTQNNTFVSKYREKVAEKNSILCVGLDPAIPKQRDKNIIPNEDRMGFMENMIELVAPFASVIKINRQYTLGLTINEIKSINNKIHDNGMLSISDHKLGDIGSSNESAIFWFKEERFDAFTYNPFSGNVNEATKMAHKYDLGIIVLTLMSNPQALLQKNAIIDGKPLFLYISNLCRESNSDGCVIGATAHVTAQDIIDIKETVGDYTIALSPGVGAQGGKADVLLEKFGRNSMINVSRGVIYSSSPAKEAEKIQKYLNTYLD